MTPLHALRSAPEDRRRRQTMAAIFARHWWILALRGVAAIAFGVLAWFWPEITLIVLVTLFGAYALVDGIFSLITAVRGRSREPRWIVAVMGLPASSSGCRPFSGLSHGCRPSGN